jgi:hypothetical protein
MVVIPGQKGTDSIFTTLSVVPALHRDGNSSVFKEDIHKVPTRVIFGDCNIRTSLYVNDMNNPGRIYPPPMSACNP